MGKVWKIEEIPTTKIVNSEAVTLTDAERQKFLKDWNEYEAKSGERKLETIRELRQDRLIATDYMSNSDVTMPDYIKTWRQSLRDLPQDNTTDSQYDTLLEKNSDGSLKHAIWKQPTS